MPRKRFSFRWLAVCCCYCCSCCDCCCDCCDREGENDSSTQLIPHAHLPLGSSVGVSPELKFSKLQVREDEEEDGGEVQEQRVTVRDAFSPQTGEVLGHTGQSGEPKAVMRSGSLLRNGGNRLSWTMMPCEQVTSGPRPTEHTQQPATVQEEDREVVLKGVEVEAEDSQGCFQTSIVVTPRK